MYVAVVAGIPPDLVRVLGPYRSRETAFRRGDAVLGSRKLVHVVEIGPPEDDAADETPAERDAAA